MVYLQTKRTIRTIRHMDLFSNWKIEFPDIIAWMIQESISNNQIRFFMILNGMRHVKIETSGETTHMIVIPSNTLFKNQTVRHRQEVNELILNSHVSFVIE